MLMLKKTMLVLFVLLLSFTAAACSKDTANEEEEGGTKKIRVVYKDEGPSNETAKKYFGNLEKALKEDEKLDVKFELVEMPQGNYAEKLNLLLMSGDIPDLIYFQGGDQQIAEQDLLEDLTPYIEKSKNIKAIMEKHNTERMKNYPYLIWIKPLDSKTPVIREDWLKQASTSKALLENPTVDNYYAFFKELVEKAPGGKGKPANAITAAGDIAELDYIFEMAFGINQTWLNSGNGYEYSKVSDQEKEKLAFYQKLYKDGLLDPQYLTKQWDTKEKAFYDGESAIIVGTNGKVVDIYNGKMKQVNGGDAGVAVLPPAKGEFQGFAPTDITKESRGLAISSQSKNKETVFKVLDYLAGPKGQMLDRLGFEGEHYTVSDKGIELNEKYYNEWYARFWEPDAFEPEKPLVSPLLSEPAEKSREMANQYYSEDNQFIIPDELISKWDAMENLYKEYATDIITGKRPIDDFDKFKEEWKKAGGDEVTEYANKEIK